LKANLPPVAITIAGSDCGGGAGLQMDLKIFSALGVYGAAVAAAITVQNSAGVRRIQGLSARLVKEQLEAVLEDLPVSAMKTGMLWSAENARVVSRQISRLGSKPPLVIDPVIWAKDGSRLLSARGLQILISELLPLATLITPNAAEAEQICQHRVRNAKEARRAAEKIVRLGAKSALVKGGHLSGELVDVLFDGKEFIEFRSRRRSRGAVHGTGCALSAAITAFLAKGFSLKESVSRSHSYLQGLIHQAVKLGKGSQLLVPVTEKAE
jgi:hydroxymethylpyrimidine/phosphomethylpyrimidine kinase